MDDRHTSHPGYQLVKSAHAWVMTNHPALTPFLMGKELIPVAEGDHTPVPCPTAMTDGERIWIHLDYATKIGFQQTCALLMEETFHIALAHSPRREGRNHKLWNVACDMSIAGILIDEGIDVSKEMKYCKEFHGMGAEEIYSELKKGMEDNPDLIQALIPMWKPDTGADVGLCPPNMNQKGDGDGDEQDGESDGASTGRSDRGSAGNGSGKSSFPGDQPDDSDGDLDPESGEGSEDGSEGEDSGGEGEGDEAGDGGGSGGGDGDAESASHPEGESLSGDWSEVASGGMVIDWAGEEGEKPKPEELKALVESAKYEAQLAEFVNQGAGSGLSVRIAKAARRTPRSNSWRDVLRNFLLDRTSVPKEDWSRPNRRYIGSCNAYLPRRDQDVAGDVVIGLDMSGSINYTQLDRMVQCLQEFLDEFGGITLHVIPFDTQCSPTEVFVAGDLIEIKASAGGGTSFSPIFKKIEGDRLAPLAVIMFTDMGASIPDFLIKQSGLDVLWVDFARPRYDSEGKIVRGECYDYIPSGTYATSFQKKKDCGWYVNMTEIQDIKRVW